MPAKRKHKPERTLLGRTVLAIAIIEPLMTVPQIYQIWATHSAAGVSVLTWLCYAGAASIWLAYGVRIKDKPLMVSSALWVITEGLVVLSALRYS